MYHPGDVAFLISQMLLEEGWLAQELSLDELVTHRVKLVPARGHVGAADTCERAPTCAPGEAMRSMVNWLFLRQTARGGEIRSIFDTPHIKGHFQEIPSEWFHWHVVLSVPWRDCCSHINVCEARARCLSVKLRARRPKLQRAKFLHLLDSQVNLSQAAKGRTSSKRMSHVLRQTSAVLLVTGMRDVVGFTRSDKNPADRASRDLRGWQRYRRAQRQNLRRWELRATGPCRSAALPSGGLGAAPRGP